jgi:hypothetical protein
MESRLQQPERNMGFLDTVCGPHGKDKFARMMMEAIRQAGETSPLHYDPEQFRLVREGHPKNESNLGGVYNEYCAAPKDKREIIFQNFVRTWFSYRREIPSEFEDVRQDLLPAIRNRNHFELTALQMRADKDTSFHWPYRVLAGSLGVGLVYDLRESMMHVHQHSLDGWKVTFDGAFEVACRNLQQGTQDSLERVETGVWMSPWRDSYDPSRMLLTDYIRGHEVTGDPVVMVPNRDTLLLAGSADADALGTLAALAEEACERSRPISGVAFRLDADDQWHPFLPADDQPHYEKFKVFQMRTICGDYADQAEALKALHEKTGEDVFVASFSALQRQDTRQIRSYCVWSEGVVALLPRTDDLFFFRPKGSEDGEVVATVPWEQAQAVLGERIKPVGSYPERYLVEGFPSEKQLAVLRSEGQAGG